MRRRARSVRGAEAAPKPPRSPWQLFYGAVHRWRRSWWRQRAGELPRPVISVGNLHWGGGGKTPLTAAVAAHLRDAGHRVCILSRGYGAPDGEGVRVVSTGEPRPAAAPLADFRVAGDEPTLLAGELPGVAVVVGGERLEAGRHALEHLPEPPDLFLLDDGFSHVRLRRDLDLLAFPVADPFGGGRLFPGGRLREPLASARHADAALLTGLRDAEAAEGHGRAAAETLSAAELADGLRPFGFTGPAFACALASHGLRWVEDGERVAPGATLLPVCAIARPGGFLKAADRAAEEAGYRVAEALTFGDHHAYPRRSLARIRRTAARRGAVAVVTTGKDRVKLAGRLGLPLAELPVQARPEPAFWTWLDERLESLPAPGGEGGGAHRGEGGGHDAEDKA